MNQEIKKEIDELKKLGIKEPGFKVPSNYFEEFNDGLFSKIQEENIPSETGFKTPDLYFENLEKTIISKINFPEKKKNTRTRILYTISSIAAAVILYFGVLQATSSESVNFESLTTTDIEDWIIAGNITLDSYDIATIDTDDLWNASLEFDDISNNEIDHYLDTVDPELLFLEN